jgi:capsid protein
LSATLSAQARTSSDRLNKQIMEAWNEWCKFCDADGDLDFKGIQALAARSMFESGECFILFRDRGFNSNMRVPLQLQVLESDFLDSAKSTVGENGNIIRQGIEFDSFNRRVAYWMWPPWSNAGCDRLCALNGADA